ncbi:glucose-6-phosphate isomerase [Solicola gregarius]|uniref:Glucose-6-phosphate isomerase n=1 Tax=Solicola gregarius TaxID=2908642 RepID=A0AA46YKS6_9ACTN|nr:glucose-6-phosphate isomerase [Solicola gregarius]UYM04904.1 glucose-6-phosphate isomerase [Solicola gregarius]
MSGADWNAAEVEANGTFRLRVGYRDVTAYTSAVEELVENRVAGRIAERDHSLWGSAAESEAAKRLAWVGLAEESRPLVAELTALRDELRARGVDHVVLCGMGGSSLAPEVICASDGVELTVVDSSHPDFVRAAIADRLERTVVVVSSKSGGTVETDSQRRAYETAFRDAGIDPAERIVVVTDPGSPLDDEATGAGYRVFHANPDVGGRYSALTAFGLVPSGLAGADIGGLLDDAAAIAPALASDDVDNPALRLGAVLGVANRAGTDKVVLVSVDTPIVGFADWAEQLLAESTGKNGKGILPVVVESVGSTNFDPNTDDEGLYSIGAGFPFDKVTPSSGWGASIDAGLGAQMLLWEYATAVAGRIIGINPFDQPDVESAKAAARGLLDGAGEQPTPAFTDGSVEVYASPDLLGDATTVAEAVTALLGRIDPDHGYVAAMAYLDRHRDSALAGVREELARRTGRPTTFGWGPRFLHSTGQYHKGGPATGVYLQITDDPDHDLDVPGRDFTFGEFIHAQAVGDASVLSEHGRPVVRLHVTDRAQGLAAIMKAVH